MRTSPALAAACFSVFGAARPAHAYDTGSIVGTECHENLTRRAFADARTALGIESPDYPSYLDEDALVSDLPFEVSSEDGFDTVAATLANREVDLGGLEPRDIARLPQIHGSDANQPEHCLRRTEQDDPAGPEEALEECRTLIRDYVVDALDALDGEGRPDFEQRVQLSTYLSIRGSVDIPLPRFYVSLGRALHALQDSFTHTYRSEDGYQVVTVLNWVELVENELDPATDGPAHARYLDECSDLDSFRELRWMRATDASTELVTIALDPALDRTAKLAAVDDLLARNISLQAGCTMENGWCGAPEVEFGGDMEPCTCTHTETGRATWLWLLGVPALLLLRRKRSLAPWLVAGALSLGAPARAEASDFGLYISASGAIMNTAVAGSIGGRYRLDEHWTFGVDAEWNPWIGGNLKKVRSGAVNAYASVIFHIPMRFESVNLRSTLQLGASRLMFDLVGVAEGSIGPYIGVNILGINWKFADGLYLVVDPAHIAIPIPQIQGVPFVFPQYRITLGLQWGA